MNLKHLSIVLVLSALSNLSFSQSSSITIQGKLTDTLNEPLPGATILLLDPADTSLLSYIKTENDGSFAFKGVKRTKYIVKATYLGFIPYMKLIDPASDKITDLGIIKLKPLANELMEVVIKAAKAPLTIRGDTIEYDASTFKVPPGSTVEDLLRRLPGLEVESDGSITSEGRNVTKVTVDGKRFFGSDPKAATKNLPAEGISKVQIFNEETEEKKLTGASSTPPDKTMNLMLKDEFKKGGFGKMVVGGGTEETYEFKGNYNKFNEKEQFSIIANANSTGRNGLSWNDYQDFKGSGANNWDDGGDFGFGSGGRRFVYYSFDEDSDEGDISNNFFGGGSAGFPENYKAGLNYNYDHKKSKFTGTYFYNQTGLISNTTRTGLTFLPDANLNNLNLNRTDNVSKNHAADFRFENDIDSLNTIIVTANLSSTDQNLSNNGEITLNRENIGVNTLSNSTVFNNAIDRTSYLTRLNAVYRKKFKKKGRSLGLSSNFVYNNTNRSSNQYSDNRFYNIQGVQDSALVVNQLNTTKSDKQEIGANAIYTEPLHKKFFWSTFYNFNNRVENVNRDVSDVQNGNISANDFLSRYYDNHILTNRLGSFVRYSYQGTNISAGVAHQRFDLKGDYEAGPTSGIKGKVDRVFYNWLPNIDMNFDLKGNKYLNASYSVTASEPSIRDLQPIIDNSNPLYIRVGNPDLKPQVEHQFSVGFNKFDPINFIRFSVNGNFSYYQDQLISEQQVSSSFVTTSRSINYTGGQSFWFWSNFGFPIIKNKFTVNLGYNPSYQLSNAFVNDSLNKTNTLGNRGSVRINFTPIENLSIYLNGSLRLSDTKYNINTSQNQSTIDQVYDIEFNAKLFWGLYLNSSFAYNKYENKRFGFNREIPILNISLYKLVLKNNRGEIRVSLYDAFNKNVSISQNSNFNTVNQTSTETLSRYAMLSFSYNIRGMKASTKSESWW